MGKFLINAFAGSPVATAGATADGLTALNTLMTNPAGMWVDALGNIYYADSNNYVIRMIDTNGIVTTFAGILGTQGGGAADGTPATSFTLSGPYGVWGDNAGNIYISDAGNIAIYRVTAGLCYTFAGGNGPGYTGDGGAATAATFDTCLSIIGDSSGNFYIADENNNVIRIINSSGIINTYAGTGVLGNSGDGGPAINAKLNNPKYMFINNNTLYVSENNDIRAIDLTTTFISTIAGSTDGSSGYSGDGGPATSALLNIPFCFIGDNMGNYYIADSENHVIRKINASGTISTFAGDGNGGYTGNGGLAIAAKLESPLGLLFNNGILYVSDLIINNIRAITFENPCFKEGTKIVALKNGNPEYVAIQDLRKGDLIKTLRNEYVPIHIIGTSPFYNPGHEERIKARLYKLSSDKYPTLTEDLIMTGCHSVLVDDFLEGQREKTKDVLGKIYVTDKKYRLPCCVDERAEPYMEPGWHTIYHFALEHDDPYMNYGVFANGLLVETCSKQYMTELSNMKELL